MRIPRNILNNGLALLFAILIVVMGIRYLKEGRSSDRSSQGVMVYLSEFDVSTMAKREDVLWLGGKTGLKGLQMETGFIIELPEPGSELDYVKELAVDSAGILWIAHDNGLARYDGNDLTLLDLSDGLPDRRVNTVYIDNDQRLWIGTWSGAAFYEDGDWITVVDDLIHPMVNTIYQDDTGAMWFGSYVAPRGGLSYFFEGKWRHWNSQNGLPHANITSIIENDTAFWIGTGLFNHGGLLSIHKDTNQLPTSRYRVFTKKDGLAGEKVRSLFIDSEKRIWCGFEYDGISILNNDSIQQLGLSAGLSHEEVKCIYQDSAGFWIGTRKGLTFFPIASLCRMLDNS